MAQVAWSVVLLDPMPTPVAIGISGPSCAGKTTLADGLCTHLCGPLKSEERCKGDKVRRFFSSCGGNRVAIIPLDNYFRKGTQNWDDTNALDHNGIYEALQQEIRDMSLNFIIVEGFRAFHDERVVDLLELLIWLEVPQEDAYNRRVKRNTKKKKKSAAQKTCTEQNFKEHTWRHHLQYSEATFSQYGQRLKHLCGEGDRDRVLDAAVSIVAKQIPWMNSAADSCMRWIAPDDVAASRACDAPRVDTVAVAWVRG